MATSMRTLHMTDALLRNVSKKQDVRDILELNLRGKKSSKIVAISGLESAVNLRVLVLSSNRIRRISGLSHLGSLRDLDLSENAITLLDGLSGLVRLERLNVSDNAIERIPVSIKKLQSLRVVRISRNALNVVRIQPPLSTFAQLRDVHHLTCLKNLSTISLEGNVISSLDHFRPYVIHAVPTLNMVDGKPVSPKERERAMERFAQSTKEVVEEPKGSVVDDDAVFRATSLAQQALERSRRAEEELSVKSDLLDRKSKELNRACELLYGMEQELAFYKIDRSFHDQKVHPHQRLKEQCIQLEVLMEDTEPELKAEHGILDHVNAEWETASKKALEGDKGEQVIRTVLAGSVRRAEQLQALSADLATRITDAEVHLAECHQRMEQGSDGEAARQKIATTAARLGRLRGRYASAIARLEDCLRSGRHSQEGGSVAALAQSLDRERKTQAKLVADLEGEMRVWERDLLALRQQLDDEPMDRSELDVSFARVEEVEQRLVEGERKQEEMVRALNESKALVSRMKQRTEQIKIDAEQHVEELEGELRAKDEEYDVLKQQLEEERMEGKHKAQKWRQSSERKDNHQWQEAEEWKKEREELEKQVQVAQAEASTLAIALEHAESDLESAHRQLEEGERLATDQFETIEQLTEDPLMSGAQATVMAAQVKAEEMKKRVLTLEKELEDAREAARALGRSHHEDEATLAELKDILAALPVHLPMMATGDDGESEEEDTTSTVGEALAVLKTRVERLHKELAPPTHSQQKQGEMQEVLREREQAFAEERQHLEAKLEESIRKEQAATTLGHQLEKENAVLMQELKSARAVETTPHQEEVVQVQHIEPEVVERIEPTEPESIQLRKQVDELNIKVESLQEALAAKQEYMSPNVVAEWKDRVEMLEQHVTQSERLRKATAATSQETLAAQERVLKAEHTFALEDLRCQLNEAKEEAEHAAQQALHSKDSEQMEHLNAKVSALEEQVLVQKQELKDAHVMERKWTETTEQLVFAEEQLTDLRAQLQTAISDLKALEGVSEQVTLFRSRLEARETELEAVREQAGDSQALRLKLHECSQRNAEKEKKMATLRATLATVQPVRSDSVGEVEELRKEVRILEGALSSREEELQTAVALRADTKQLRHEVRELSKKLDDRIRQLVDVQVRLEEKDAELDEERRRADQWQSDAQRSMDQVKRLESRLQQTKDAQQELEEMRGRLAAITKEAQDQVDQVDRVSEAMKAQREAEERAEHAEKRLESAEQHLKVLRDAMGTLETMSKQKETALNKDEAQREKEQEAVVERAQQATEQAQQHAEEWKRLSEQTQSEVDALRKELREERAKQDVHRHPEAQDLPGAIPTPFTLAMGEKKRECVEERARVEEKGGMEENQKMVEQKLEEEKQKMAKQKQHLEEEKQHLEEEKQHLEEKVQQDRKQEEEQARIRLELEGAKEELSTTWKQVQSARDELQSIGQDLALVRARLSDEREALRRESKKHRTRVPPPPETGTNTLVDHAQTESQKTLLLTMEKVNQAKLQLQSIEKAIGEREREHRVAEGMLADVRSRLSKELEALENKVGLGQTMHDRKQRDQVSRDVTRSARLPEPDVERSTLEDALEVLAARKDVAEGEVQTLEGRREELLQASAAIQHQVLTLAQREQALIEREGKVATREAEVGLRGSQDHVLVATEQTIHEAETRFQTLQQSIVQVRQELDDTMELAAAQKSVVKEAKEEAKVAQQKRVQAEEAFEKAQVLAKEAERRQQSAMQHYGQVQDLQARILELEAELKGRNKEEEEDSQVQAAVHSLMQRLGGQEADIFKLLQRLEQVELSEKERETTEAREASLRKEIGRLQEELRLVRMEMETLGSEAHIASSAASAAISERNAMSKELELLRADAASARAEVLNVSGKAQSALSSAQLHQKELEKSWKELAALRASELQTKMALDRERERVVMVQRDAKRTEATLRRELGDLLSASTASEARLRNLEAAHEQDQRALRTSQVKMQQQEEFADILRSRVQEMERQHVKISQAAAASEQWPVKDALDGLPPPGQENFPLLELESRLEFAIEQVRSGRGSKQAKAARVEELQELLRQVRERQQSRKQPSVSWAEKMKQEIQRAEEDLDAVSMMRTALPREEEPLVRAEEEELRKGAQELSQAVESIAILDWRDRQVIERSPVQGATPEERYRKARARLEQRTKEFEEASRLKQTRLRALEATLSVRDS